MRDVQSLIVIESEKTIQKVLMKNTPEKIFSDAKSYEGYVGRWSRLIAKQFLDWLDIPSKRKWLDVGAGTGILSQIILQETDPAYVLGIDLSEDYISFARQHVQDSRLEFRVADALSTTVEQSQFDVAVSGLVLNFVPSPEQASKNMFQTLIEGGTLAAYVWDYSGQMEMMRYFWDAAIKIDSAASEMDAGQRFTIAKPENLKTLFQTLGLKEVELIPIDIQTEFKDFDDYWLPFLGAQGSVFKYLRGLSEEKQAALREQVFQDLPVEEDGRIILLARAWAVKGKK